MIKTFTPPTQKIDGNTKVNSTDPLLKYPVVHEPSDASIQNILNYSRCLEIIPSQFVHQVEILKS